MLNYDRLNTIYDCCGTDLRSILSDLGLSRGDIIHAGIIMEKYNMTFPQAYRLLEALRYCGVTQAPDVMKNQQFDTVMCQPLQMIKPLQITSVLDAFERVLSS